MSVLCWIGIVVTNWPWAALCILILFALLTSNNQRQSRSASEGHGDDDERTQTLLTQASNASKSVSPIKSITLSNQAGEKVSFQASSVEYLSIKEKYKKKNEDRHKQITKLRSEVGQLKSAQEFDDERHQEELKEMQDKLQKAEADKLATDRALQEQTKTLRQIQTDYHDAYAATEAAENEIANLRESLISSEQRNEKLVNEMQEKLDEAYHGGPPGELALQMQMRAFKLLQMQLRDTAAAAKAAEEEATELRRALASSQAVNQRYHTQVKYAEERLTLIERELDQGKKSLEAQFSVLETSLEKTVTSLERVTSRSAQGENIPKKDFEVLQEQHSALIQELQMLRSLKVDFEAKSNEYREVVSSATTWIERFYYNWENIVHDLRQSLIEQGQLHIKLNEGRQIRNKEKGSWEARLHDLRTKLDNYEARIYDGEQERDQLRIELNQETAENKEAHDILHTAHREYRRLESQYEQLNQVYRSEMRHRNVVHGMLIRGRRWQTQNHRRTKKLEDDLRDAHESLENLTAASQQMFYKYYLLQQENKELRAWKDQRPKDQHSNSDMEMTDVEDDRSEFFESQDGPEDPELYRLDLQQQVDDLLRERNAMQKELERVSVLLPNEKVWTGAQLSVGEILQQDNVKERSSERRDWVDETFKQLGLSPSNTPRIGLLDIDEAESCDDEAESSDDEGSVNRSDSKSAEQGLGITIPISREQEASQSRKTTQSKDSEVATSKRTTHSIKERLRQLEEKKVARAASGGPPPVNDVDDFEYFRHRGLCVWCGSRWHQVRSHCEVYRILRQDSRCEACRGRYYDKKRDHELRCPKRQILKLMRNWESRKGSRFPKIAHQGKKVRMITTPKGLGKQSREISPRTSDGIA